MGQDLRFQVLILPNQPWEKLLDRFIWAEELGFDLVVTADHFVDWTNPPSPWFELWTLLSAVAQATTQIRIAPCVAQIPLRNPVFLARQALTVGHISNGRLEIGLGLGLPIDPSYDVMGIPNWSNSERAARFKEYVEIVDRLLSHETTPYKGRFYEVNHAVIHPRPRQVPRPPITIGAMGPLMLQYAATYADTWNTMSFAEAFEDQLRETAARVTRVTKHCDTIGRDVDSLRFSYNMFDARARSSGGRMRCYESPERFADMIRQIVALGMSEIGLYYPMVENQVPVFETIAQEVIPALRTELATAP